MGASTVYSLPNAYRGAFAQNFLQAYHRRCIGPDTHTHPTSDPIGILDERMDYDATREEDHEAFQSRLLRFVDAHESTLADLQQSFSNPSDATCWDAAHDVVSLSLGCNLPSTLKFTEKNVADAVGTTISHDYPFLFRTTVCFVSAVVEMQSLAAHLREVLLPPLILFGDDTCRGAATVEEASGMIDAEAQCGVLQLLSSHLQALWSWQRRVKDVVRYAFRQLGALSQSSSLASASQETATLLPGVRIMTVWKALAELLGVVATLEEVLQQHTTLLHGFTALQKWVGRRIAAYRRRRARERNDEGAAPPVEDAHETDTLVALQAILRIVSQDLLSGTLLERMLLDVDNAALLGVAPPFGECQDPPVMLGLNAAFRTEFYEVLCFLLDNTERSMNSPRESSQHSKLMGIAALFVTYSRLFHQPRGATTREVAAFRGLCKRLYVLTTDRIPVVYIDGMYVIYPSLWLVNYLPHDFRGCAKVDPHQDQQQALRIACERRASLFLPLLNRLITIISLWVTDMQTTEPVGSAARDATFVEQTALLVQRGLFLAHDLQHAMSYLIALHHCCNRSLPAPLLDGILLGVTLLVEVRHQYHAKMGIIGSTFNCVVRAVAYVMERHLYAIHSKLTGSRQAQGSLRSGSMATDQILGDQLGAVSGALSLLHRPHTPENIAALSVMLDIAFNRSDCHAHTAELPRSEDTLMAFAQLSRLVTYQVTLRETTSCRFLYCHRESVYPFFLKRLYQSPLNARKLPLLVAALQDVSVLLGAQHVTRPATLVKAYVAYLRHCITTAIVNPLCTEVEAALRLHAHQSVLRSGGVQSATAPANSGSCPTTEVFRDATHFTRLPPFRFFDEWMDLAALVEDYLDAQFYHLCALTLNDWKTYEAMRPLAKERYGLTLCDGFLPGGTSDQGLDVLVITEGIHVFIAHYTYNLNEQIFVQRPTSTESKHLHTLQIRHVSNSIRTHGPGIVNTAVNFVYRCLMNKIAILSQFLYDEHVKSRLLKEEQYVAQQRKQLRHGGGGASDIFAYPMARAHQFIGDLRVLGLAEDGGPFLDKFRCLVSEIGNALGYVRMMRSGSLRAIAEAAQFLPVGAAASPSSAPVVRLAAIVRAGGAAATHPTEEDGENSCDSDDGSFGSEHHSEKSENVVAPTHRDVTLRSVQSVDRVTRNLRTKLSKGSEYFPLLLAAMGSGLRATTCDHLHLFYLIVPPMCVSVVEHLVYEKEKLLKKDTDAIFTDDGFALGCAFLLSLLGVEEAFDGLHWFESVRTELLQRLAKVHEVLMDSGRSTTPTVTAVGTKAFADNNKELINNMHLSAATLDTLLREYVWLEETYTSSTVFFCSSAAAAPRTDTSGSSSSSGEEDERSRGRTSGTS